MAGLQAETEHWKQFYGGVADVHSPEDVARMVTALREEAREMGTRLAEAQTDNARLTGTVDP